MIDKVKQLIRYQKIKAFYDRYERFLMPATLLSGLAFDFLTFKNIESNSALALVAFYFIVAGSAIAFIHFYDTRQIPPEKTGLKYLRLAAKLAVQFTFGALLNWSFIFYWFSGAFSVSWPFILLIAVLMVSNDVLRHYFFKSPVQISIYSFIVFSIFPLEAAYLFNSLESWLFFLASVLGLLFIAGYIILLSSFLPQLKARRWLVLTSIGVIFVLMNSLYFLNIIPPIPLALREAGVYHNISRSGGSYLMQAEVESFWQRLNPRQTFHRRAGERVYVYTAIFAPTELNTTIVHDWQYYDRQAKKWVSKDKLSFRVAGGRQEGYRGYSFKTAMSAGTWRVDVETPRGQVLGRVRFTVEDVTSQPNLQELRR